MEPVPIVEKTPEEEAQTNSSLEYLPMMALFNRYSEAITRLYPEASQDAVITSSATLTGFDMSLRYTDTVLKILLPPRDPEPKEPNA